jgi:hypothetical protein
MGTLANVVPSPYAAHFTVEWEPSETTYGESIIRTDRRFR